MPIVDEPIDDDTEDIDEPFESMTTPARPTKHLPGTNAKIEVLRRRLERGELLWHPDDMTFEQFAIEQDTIDAPPCMVHEFREFVN